VRVFFFFSSLSRSRERAGVRVFFSFDAKKKEEDPHPPTRLR
jgi:hypothetical protein